jgi:peptidoglycan/LPS O-acetylase OafA/YrhL
MKDFIRPAIAEEPENHPDHRTKSVLVTGGAGFLGSHLCETLLCRAEQVICLDNFQTGYERNISHLRHNPAFSAIAGASHAIAGRPETTRRVQIDGLRAIAMVGVLYVHFWDANPLTENVRVSLFFVISGFLITHILCNGRRRGGQIQVLNFYIRRALRLFPALAMLVMVASLFDMDGFRSSALWHLFQLSNVYYSIHETEHPWVTGHLWSLNVLEQFYLIAPVIILLLSLKRLYVVVLLLWAVAVFLRTNAQHLGEIAWLTPIVLPFDPIVAGVFTSLVFQYRPIAEVLTSKIAVIVSMLTIMCPLVLWEGFGHSESYRLMIQPALCSLVAGAFQGYRGPVGWILASRPAQFLSKISYGVYIYHLAIWWFVAEAYPQFYKTGPMTFVVLSSISVAVAAMSWYAIEYPISQLKSRFPTSSEPIATRVGGEVAALRRGADIS